MSKLETNIIDTVSGTANLTIGGANNTGTTTIKTNDTAAITIDSSQNVGIGTSSPSSKLEVVGNITAPRTSTNGQTRTLLLGGARNGSNNPFANIDFEQYDDSGTSVDFIGARISGREAGSDDASLSFYTANNTILSEAMSIGKTGNVNIVGSLSKGSGSFKIDHPLPSKNSTHYLVHSFTESPQADLIYRGKVDLVNGTATVNIDTAAGMSEGTFVLLNTNIQCFTSNETGWTAVKGSVSGNTLTITAQDNTCDDTISWLVIGERQDQHMIDTEWTDENGKVIVEPLKPVEEEQENA